MISHIIWATISILVWFYILKYIFQLESDQCLCALDWRHTYIKYYIIFVIAFLFLNLFNSSKPNILTAMITFVTFIMYTGVVFSYISDLKKLSCSCSEHTARNILEAVNYLQIIIISFVLIYVLYTLYGTRGTSSVPPVEW
jgi:hypothetical protein